MMGEIAVLRQRQVLRRLAEHAVPVVPADLAAMLLIPSKV
jgi:hypothetical protein